jgi:hypothetical protein
MNILALNVAQVNASLAFVKFTNSEPTPRSDSR